MIVKLLTEHHLEFLSLKGGCRGSSVSTWFVKMSNCWKSHAGAHLSSFFMHSLYLRKMPRSNSKSICRGLVLCKISDCSLWSMRLTRKKLIFTVWLPTSKHVCRMLWVHTYVRIGIVHTCGHVSVFCSSFCLSVRCFCSSICASYDCISLC